MQECIYSQVSFLTISSLSSSYSRRLFLRVQLFQELGQNFYHAKNIPSVLGLGSANQRRHIPEHPKGIRCISVISLYVFL